MQHIHRWGLPLAAFAATCAIILFGLAVLYTFRQQDHVDQQLCQSTVRNRQAVRATWVTARHLVLAGTEQDQKKQSLLFFRAILRPIPPLHCVDNKPVPR